MKVAVYTAIFGGKDILHEPIGYKHSEDIQYFVITDNPNIESFNYKIIHQKTTRNDITKNARKIKILGFKELEKFDVAIWHDANLAIKHYRILELSKLATKYSLSAYSHAQRNCVYEEGIACIKLNKDYPIRITFQMFLLALKGVRPNSGIYATCILVKNVRKYNNENIGYYWWNWINYLSRRDQLSINAAILKTGSVVGIIEGHYINDSKYSVYKPHLNSYYKVGNKNYTTSNKYVSKICIKFIRFIKLIKLVNMTF